MPSGHGVSSRLRRWVFAAAVLAAAVAVGAIVVSTREKRTAQHCLELYMAACDRERVVIPEACSRFNIDVVCAVPEGAREHQASTLRTQHDAATMRASDCGVGDPLCGP